MPISLVPSFIVLCGNGASKKLAQKEDENSRKAKVASMLSSSEASRRVCLARKPRPARYVTLNTQDREQFLIILAQ